jgi:phosphoribulokinase
MASDRQHPVVVGIVGDSAAGKTTFAAGIAAALGPERAVTICADDYHRYSRRERGERGLTPHDPACNYMDILEQHLFLLRQGEPILKPVYNHNGGVLEAPEYVEPKPFIILEGLLGFASPQLRDSYDVKIYLEPQEQLRLRWKYQRDTGTSGYTVEQVMAAIDRLARDSRLHVVPQREYADIIVSFQPPDDAPDEKGARLMVRHTLRPTLPPLDLAPLLEAGAGTVFQLELARDADGRPVDSLHISADIGAADAEAVKTHFWNRLSNGRPSPHSAHQPALGLYRNGGDRVHGSHPLALSQILITEYLLAAAHGDDAP